MKELVNDKYEKILEIRVGSHLYGTNTPESDEDFSGIIMPVAEEVFGFEKMEQIDNSTKSKKESGKNDKDAIDKTYFEFRKFIKLAIENNPNVLEQIWVNDSNIIYCSELGSLLLAMRSLFPHKGLNQKYIAYAKSQKHKMTLKPDNYHALQTVLDYLYDFLGNDTIVNLSDKEQITKARSLFVERRMDIDNKNLPVSFNDSFIKIGDININKNQDVKQVINTLNQRIKTATHRKELWDKYGYDSKFCSHSFRLLYEGISLLETGSIEFPLKQKDYLVDIKSGKFTLGEVLIQLDELEKVAEDVFDKSSLRSKPEYDKIQQFVVKTMKEYFR